MGVVDVDGKPIVDLKTLVGPPVIANCKKIKADMQAAKTAVDDDDGNEDTPGVASLCPHGAGFRTLHRNFHLWKQMPPGWKRRLLADTFDISLGTIEMSSLRG